MYESETPENAPQTDAPVPDADDAVTVEIQPAEETTLATAEASAPVADEMLDGFEADLDDVASALEALDADDLDGAEALTSGLATVEGPAEIADEA